jgi:hypothetical protein
MLDGAPPARIRSSILVELSRRGRRTATALAARGSADAALGVAEAIAAYVRSRIEDANAEIP